MRGSAGWRCHRNIPPVRAAKHQSNRVRPWPRLQPGGHWKRTTGESTRATFQAWDACLPWTFLDYQFLPLRFLFNPQQA